MSSILKKFWSYIKHNLVIFFVLLWLLELAFLLWQETAAASEFGLNFFTELLGVGITVFLVEELIKAREEKKNLGPKTLAYKNIMRFVHRYIWFWRDIYRTSVPKSEPDTIKDFFTRENISWIWFYLDLDASINNDLDEVGVGANIKKFLFTGTYWEFIPNRMQKFEKQLDKILKTYANYLEPEILTSLIEINENGLINRLGNGLVRGKASYDDNLKGREHLDTRPLLKNWSGGVMTEKEAANILALHKWCLDNYSKYGSATVESDYINLLYNKPLSYEEGTVKPNMIMDLTGYDKPPVFL
jgi:hypothetical protein